MRIQRRAVYAPEGEPDYRVTSVVRRRSGMLFSETLLDSIAELIGRPVSVVCGSERGNCRCSKHTVAICVVRSYNFGFPSLHGHIAIVLRPM